MIDPATSAKIPGMDASLAGSAASHRSDAKAGNGFYDALSNAGHSGRSRQDREAGATGQTFDGDAAAGAEAGVPETKATKPGRPVIDVSQSALSRASAANSARGAMAGDAAAGAEAGVTETKATKPGRPLINVSQSALSRASAASSARGATAGDGATEAATEAAGDDTPADRTAPGRKAAKAVAGQAATAGNGATGETLDAGQVAAVVKHVQTAKGDKAERTDKPTGEAETEAPTDGEVETTPGGKASDLGDVLTLLSNAATTAPQAGQANLRADRTTTGGTAGDDMAAVNAFSGDVRTSRTVESSDLPSVETAEADTAEADRSFRFLRADGKGQALSMVVGQSDGETAKYDIGSAKDGGQTVAVLDARRYIAPASTNAAGLTAAMMGDGEWASAMLPGSELANAASQSSSGKVVNTLKLQMSPIELGNVTATLRLSGEELSVQITVETHAAYKQLSSDQDDMLKALRAHGFAVDQIQISVNVAAADRADGGQSGAQGQSTGQQAQGGAQGGNGSGERRTAALQAENGTGTGKTADDTSALQTASGGAGGSRPGHVYL